MAVWLCYRNGLPLFSRQFLGLSKARMDTLLMTFPRLLKADQQHTYVENDSVRFIFHPLESYYLVIATNLQSNLLQDMDTLLLMSRTLTDLGSVVDEDFLREKMFEVILAFDEIVNNGYKENVTGSALSTILAMESHEEIVQEIIAKVNIILN